MGAGKRVFAGLDAEWALVCADSAGSTLVRSWISEAGVAAREELPEDLGELVACLMARRESEVDDRWLVAVLERATTEGRDAQLAARVVVQAMVPGMVRLTQSLLTPQRDFDDVAQVVVSCLYIVARTYPLHRRRKVAANLVLETLHHASRQLALDEELALRLDDQMDLPLRGAADVAEQVSQRLLVERGLVQQFAAVTAVEEADGAEGELAALLAWGVDRGSLPLEQARAVVCVLREEAERTGAASPAARKRRSRVISALRPVAAEWVRAA
ncbi:hypothetical protein [Streptomyces sp. NPDC047803]|uniref:hypothetical protein n=1 Tax=unclassified Streptomyces TaxID=2593676 RepID=UPI0033E6235A